MFSSALRSSLVALAASAISASAELTLKVSGPESVTGVDNLKVTATLTNTGSEALQLLNDPRSLLTKVPTNSFRISSSTGASPSFNGIKVKYVPSVAAKSSSASFTTIEAGKSVDITHDLSSAYNFTLSGPDDYQINPATIFYAVDPSTLEVSTVKATVGTSLKTKLAGGTLSIARRTPKTKRASFDGCSADQQSTIEEAVDAANTYANNALSYLQGISDGTERYTTWFGEFDSSRYNTVTDHFNNIATQGYDDYTYDCSTCDLEGTYAYVYPDEFGTIYLCDVFWQTTTTGTDSRGGTLIHESTHFTRNAGTDDHVYGQSGAQDLAQSDPDTAIDNADSHEYFAENNPALD
ncbi:hypothetical protein D9758_012954 [Tetrapyrgos nigripes]|uniref:Lysine-specific metallo-endopeptidase domain-containing protein n=1 Tax=Tetrapyrgos nigripes TaxID=182062 RepID=A0A8H5CKQ0_9AGAR|nr:hypothetical protein D9758_012954 [Tetrapyrgos nigripes]